MPTEFEILPSGVREYKVGVDAAEDMSNRFKYHAPKDDQMGRYEYLRNQSRAMATSILHNTPRSREQSIAITKLEEVMFWANAAIARNE